MPPIPAHLVLQIDRPTYAISDADFVELRKAVGAELLAHVPTAIWTAWAALTLPSDQPTPTEVRTAIVDALKLYNNDPGQTWTLSLTGGDSTAQPLATEYTFENGVRTCHCDFALDVTKPTRPLARWEVSYTNSAGKTFTVGINTSFSWEAPWNQ